MATINETLPAKLATLDYDGIALVEWAALTKATDDVGRAVNLAQFADRSVQVTGTFGTGGSVRIEGSLDGTNYYALTDPQGNALDITTAKIEAVSEMTLWIRPRVTAGDGITSLTVRLVARAD
jgi:hypothetical protein